MATEKTHPLAKDQTRELRIAVLVDVATGYGRDVLRGISVFSRNRPHWVLGIVPVNAQSQPAFSADLDGLIIQGYQRRITDRVARLGIAAVNVGDAMDGHSLPSVISDHFKIGILACETFLERGFRRLAFLGEAEQFYAQRRFEGFQHRAREAGLSVHTCWLGNGSGPREEAVATWLRSLPRPIGLAACHDGLARMTAQICHGLDVAIPRDLAIVGTDNDELLCELSDPPLSSVAVAGDRIGYEAAALLEKLMQGQAPPAHVGVVPPVGVVRRRSSDVLASDNELVNEAAAFIWRFATQPISIDEVARRVGISRRSLEQHFEQALGRTPVSVLRQARLERIKDMLVSTDMPLSRIAEESGLSDSASLSRFFRRETGITPSQFRRRSRLE
jgi:LacI family transcriptional regulator